MRKKLLIIIPIVAIMAIGFIIYWFWPQPQIPSIIDEGQRISQETRKIIEDDNNKHRIKFQYIFYDDTTLSLPDVAKTLSLDPNRDVLYILMRPLDEKDVGHYANAYYVQASPELEKKLVDYHPYLTNTIGPYLYGKNYDKAILEANDWLRIDTYLIENNVPKNPYKTGFRILFILLIILIVLSVLVQILSDDDDIDSHHSDDMLAVTTATLANSITINNIH